MELDTLIQLIRILKLNNIRAALGALKSKHPEAYEAFAKEIKAEAEAMQKG